MGAAAGAYFASAGSGFPNVAYPYFNALAYSLDVVAQVRGIAWLPLVLPSQLQSFEAFANATLGSQWANASYTQLGYTNITDFTAGVAKVTHNVQGGLFAGNASVHRPINASALYYFPLIQEAPLHTNEAVIMYDLNSEPTRAAAIAAVMANGQPATTDWLYLVQDTNLGLKRIASLALTPVIVGGAIVGLSNTVFNWDSVILQSLPSFESGIDTVLSSSLSNRTFTMRIINGAVVGVGEGDQHESNALVNSYASTVSASLGANWTLTIYPTTALIDGYHHDGPKIILIVVVLVILACFALFALHNWLVSSHSLFLLRIVTATSRIVDDVFPKSVKARMMKQALDRDEAPGASAPAAAGEGKNLSQGAVRVLGLIQKMVGIEAATERVAARKSSQLVLSSGSGPIADTFPAVTVLFADIAGFTAWAAVRPPEVVFAFLGSLWCTFDELCAVRGIFKVETVGDQYSALPSARRVPQLIDSAPFSVRLRPSRAHRGACRTHGGFRAGHGGGDAQGLRRQRGRGPVHARGAAQRHLSGRGVDGRARPVSVVWGHGEHRQPDGEHRRGGAGAGERDHGAAAAAQRPV